MAWLTSWIGGIMISTWVSAFGTEREVDVLDLSQAAFTQPVIEIHQLCHRHRSLTLQWPSHRRLAWCGPFLTCVSEVATLFVAEVPFDAAFSTGADFTTHSHGHYIRCVLTERPQGLETVQIGNNVHTHTNSYVLLICNIDFCWVCEDDVLIIVVYNNTRIHHF